MSTTTMVAIYFLVWWVTLFAVLPWGIQSQQESGDYAAGTDPGAPAMARMARKLVWTTVVATAIFALFYIVYAFKLISIDALMTFFNPR